MNLREKWKRQMVDLANETGPALDGSIDQIKQIFADADIVYGVWQDPAEEDGVGVLLMKGAHVLRDIVSSNISKQVRTSALPCTCYEQALVAKQKFGDGEHGGLDA
jgi:hypothetical protein